MADKEKGERIAIPLEFRIPDDLQTHYATNMVVQHGRHEFVIYFFEAHPPLFLGASEGAKSHIEQLESIPAKCVSKIVVSADTMEEFINVWKDNFEKYKSQYQKKENADE